MLRQLRGSQLGGLGPSEIRAQDAQLPELSCASERVNRGTAWRAELISRFDERARRRLAAPLRPAREPGRRARPAPQTPVRAADGHSGPSGGPAVFMPASVDCLPAPTTNQKIQPQRPFGRSCRSHAQHAQKGPRRTRAERRTKRRGNRSCGGLDCGGRAACGRWAAPRQFAPQCIYISII